MEEGSVTSFRLRTQRMYLWRKSASPKWWRENATTAMSLRLLEKLSRNCSPGWSIVDLGTGSGILALAAKRLGATRVIGIDNDPIAISTAKQNAQLNKIRGVHFRVADIHHWRF